ncbi:DNA-binding domain-containing protein [Pseudoxanthomonas sp.]|uniref:HvfC/BufC N-terminal domain-containing protein n=1 Tax=Pseudoxanthomonas sp. TaxID=1871049 RepID=UPI002612AA72|nr:DNA-binding domain-containing protein [Pseudoxanthomonas sp.]WDS35811.1 MAG: DNA-binding domain-containing protein [Pseudoxanthomonas sp.]
MSAFPLPSATPAAVLPAWDNLQTAFAQALLDAGQPVPPGLVGPDGRTSARRFGVYRNNVVAGLVHALRDGFPAVARIVGEAFFAAMTQQYALQHPPRTPVMLAYGAELADFVAGFAPAASVPYLADVARLEWAWIEAYHAAESTPLQPEDLQRLEPRNAAQLHLRLHPSARVLRSPYPAVTIWQMNTDALALAPVAFDAGGEDVLVVRPHAHVQAHPLPAGAAVFIQSLIDGLDLGQATACALDDDGGFDLASSLSGLVSAGACIALDDPADPFELSPLHR